jgi:cyclopropane-fatty-acyl-phospholipid synthase
MLDTEVIQSNHVDVLTPVQRAARHLVLKSLRHLSVGQLTLIESFPTTDSFSTSDDCSPMSSGRSICFGSPAPDGCSATVEIKRPDCYQRMVRGGSIGAAEAYMDGWWETPCLVSVTHLMARNLNALDTLEQNASLVQRTLYRVGHWLNRNSIGQSKQNIHAHYDLGNPFYEKFLDTNMLYSSAVFDSEKETLEQAQINKMERLCQQLELTQDDHVLEVGTGWGAMAIYMAENYGCKVTTTTISDEQYDYAHQQICALGLEQQITLLKQDYRLLDGQYDKLVSIEMVEAVGRQYLNQYVAKCSSLLKPNGKMALQAITIADQRYDYYAKNVDFIQKYIFPGGFLPSITALTTAFTRNTNLVVRDLKDLGLDYAQTLKLWRVRFDASEQAIRGLGYDDRFIRMWRYYLCYCEGGFRARAISTIHLTLDKV